MEARRLTQRTQAGATRAAPPEAQRPFFAPIARWFADTDPRARGELDLGRLNALARQRALRTESGKAVRFVDAHDARSGSYERVVDEDGRVPTRTRGDGMLHDWFNALAWLAFPRSKARLNAVHARALADASREGAAHARDAERSVRIHGRGRVRDAATLFDESGAIFSCGDRSLRDAFVARDWNALFVHERAAFVRGVRVVVFGHALFEKLLDPYKAICAQAVVLSADDPCADAVSGANSDAAGARSESAGSSIDAIDVALAAHLRADTLAAGVLHPLPVLGVPGWYEENANPAFYDDACVFRRERRRRQDAPERTASG